MARSLGVPWGISESAYNARDLEFTYQYSNFGVPGLGLKRGLARERRDRALRHRRSRRWSTRSARRAQLRTGSPRLGARGRYGFYEALDFTPPRLPEGERVAIVRSFMAHHQGMTHRRHRQRAAGRRDARALPRRADDPGDASCCCRSARRATSPSRSRGPRRSRRRRPSAAATPPAVRRLTRARDAGAASRTCCRTAATR